MFFLSCVIYLFCLFVFPVFSSSLSGHHALSPCLILLHNLLSFLLHSLILSHTFFQVFSVPQAIQLFVAFTNMVLENPESIPCVVFFNTDSSGPFLFTFFKTGYIFYLAGPVTGCNIFLCTPISELSQWSWGV